MVPSIKIAPSSSRTLATNGADVGILSIWFWALGGWGVGGLKDVDIDIDTCHTQLYSCL